MYFPSTHWSLLAQASFGGEPEARRALEELCQRYWLPLRQFIGSRGYSETEAEDLTQEFILHLLERSALRKPDPLRGKFRSFLLGALANFLSHERERRLAQKRGGQQMHVSIEALGDDVDFGSSSLVNEEVAAFDRAWALTIVRAALEAVAQQYAGAGKSELFAVLRAFLPGGQPPPSYEETAIRSGLSVAALNSEIHRLRRQFRDCLSAEVTSTVSAPHEIDEEIAHLYRVLLNRGTDFCAMPKS
jgi:DNA-directed RNA polymerase specialized sigma24 family protein